MSYGQLNKDAKISKLVQNLNIETRIKGELDLILKAFADANEYIHFSEKEQALLDKAQSMLEKKHETHLKEAIKFAQQLSKAK